MRNLMTPGLTARDLASRKSFVCASECSAIVGSSPWHNAADVYEWKVRELAPQETSEAQEFGQLVEGILLIQTEKSLRKFLNEPGLKITRRGIRRKHPNKIMACTLDAVVVGRNEAIEVKTHALIHNRADLSEWGPDAWTDAVPPYVRDQVLFQQACCPEIVRTWIPFWTGGRSLLIYCIERANYLARIAFIEEACCNFNDHHLVPLIEPDMAPQLGTIKRDITPRLDVAVANLADAPVEQTKALAAQIKVLQDEKDALDAGLRRDMSGFMRGVTPAGHKVNMTVRKSKGYSVAAKTYTTMKVYMSK
ncbi:MAG: YqaJ viral recombinase family protein [Phycisphaerae bacterium]